MKKEVVIIFLFLFSIFLVYAQSSLDVVQGNLDKVDKVNEQIETYTDKTYWSEKWDYLGREWKTILLKNKAIAGVNSFFEKISIVFVILFGVPYEISFVLFGIIFLWILFLTAFYDIFRGTFIVDIFGKIGTFLLSLILVIGLAQLGFFNSLAIFIGRLIFSPEGKWARFLIFIGFCIVVFIFSYLSKFLGKYLKAKRELDEKEMEKLNRTLLGRFMKEFMRASDIH